MNNKIFYGIIIACIACIVCIVFIDNPISDVIFGIILAVGIVSGVYLILKNEREELQKIEEERQINVKKQLNDEQQKRLRYITPEIEAEKKKEKEEEELFKQIDTEYINTLSLYSQNQLIDKREQTQKDILQIIKNNKYTRDNKYKIIDKISVLIINSMFDINAEFPEDPDFFTNYKYAYLIPIKKLDNADITDIDTIDYIISKIDEYKQKNDYEKKQYRNKYNPTKNTEEYNWGYEEGMRYHR